MSKALLEMLQIIHLQHTHQMASFDMYRIYTLHTHMIIDSKKGASHKPAGVASQLQQACFLHCEWSI